MKKRLVTLVLCAALVLSTLPAAGAAFTDISDPDTALAAATLQGLGIVSGTSSATFDPNSTLTRAEACTMAVNAMGLSRQVGSAARKTLFSDVPSNAWYNGYVNLAYAQGVINGYGDGTFGPNDPVTYGQLATILLRMLGYTSADIGSVWPLDYTAFCEDLGLADGLSLSPMRAVTRGQAGVLIYNALKENVNGSSKVYYQTIYGVSSTSEVILLDVDADYGGGTGLVMAYTLGNDGGVEYYTQANAQSDALVGSVGALLFDGAGRVVGFVPESSGCQDLVIGSATATAITTAGGASYRISSGAQVICGGELYPYSTSGYLQINSKAGKTVRLFYDDDGAVTYLYLAGGTARSSQAAVASSASAASSLVQQLGISGQSYSITKNGAEAAASDLARYDVGYYDGAAQTLRVSDYRVCGYLSAASPSVAAAETITVAGYTFQVLESAWDTLSGFTLGDKVTLLLTDDGKVAAVYRASALPADMVGVLDQSGKSVTLVGSGIILSAGTMDYSDSALGGLVTVTASSASTLRCTAVSSSGKSLNLAERTLGGLDLAPSCAIYEWAGGGYVYDLEGNQGAASGDFDEIDWTDSLSASCVSYYHTNSAGQVDLVLLTDVTGNAYDYGKIRLTTNSGGEDGYTTGATLENSSGTSSNYMFNVSGSTSGYVGIALGRSSQGYTRVVKVQKLTAAYNVSEDDFVQRDGSWYVDWNGTEYRVSDRVEIHVSDAGVWLSGESGLLSVLGGGYDLTVCYDSVSAGGGRIRLIRAERAD